MYTVFLICLFLSNHCYMKGVSWSNKSIPLLEHLQNTCLLFYLIRGKFITLRRVLQVRIQTTLDREPDSKGHHCLLNLTKPTSYFAQQNPHNQHCYASSWTLFTYRTKSRGKRKQQNEKIVCWFKEYIISACVLFTGHFYQTDGSSGIFKPANDKNYVS